MKVPVVIQMQPGENGAAALCMILGAYKRFVPLEEMREKCVLSRNGSAPEQLIRTASAYGLDGRVEELAVSDLKDQDFPLMVCWKKRYYCIIRSVKKGIVSVTDPANGEYRMTLEKFSTLYSGKAILFEKTGEFKPGGRRVSLISLIRERIDSLKETFIALFVFSLLCAWLNLLMAHIPKTILDKNLAGENSVSTDPEGMRRLCIYLLLLILYTVFGILRTRLVNKASRRSSAVSGSRLFKHMFSQPMRFFEQFSPGELISRIDTNTKLDNSIIRSIVPRGIDAVMTMVYIVTLFIYNPVIAAVCLVIVTGHVALTMYIQERNAIVSKSMATGTGIVRTSLLNGMNMIDTIRSTGAERDFYNLWYDSQLQLNGNRLKGMRLGTASMAAGIINRYTLAGVQLFMGAYFIRNGNYTLGTMSLFESVLNSMISSLGNCMTMTDMLQQMRTGIERVNDVNHRSIRPVIPLPKDEYGSADKLEGKLTARHICYRYNKGDDPAVDDVSLDVQPGQMIAIVGATGCGKSTLLKVLSGLYEPESGQILYSGKQRDEIPDVVFNSSVTTVDQETVMFQDSVYNNIRMWDPTIEHYEVIMASIDAQIHNRITRDALSYGVRVEENGQNFSGGELQRLELARALAHEPTILFLDEFTSALDALTEDRIIRALKNKGTTCVIVAHRLSTIMDCDRIYVMDKGRVVQEGTHSELYAAEGLYRELIGSQ